MTIEEIRETLNSDEYEFIKTNEHLGSNIILLTCGGSHAYGTNRPDSDLDIRGIALERKSDILGLSNFENFDSSTTDTVIYGLRKIVTLLSNCNPNTIELLGTKDDQLFICDKYGKMLRDNRSIFISRKAINSFGGYANQQLRRLKTALLVNNNDSDEKEKYKLEAMQKLFSSMSDRYEYISPTNFHMYIDKSTKNNIDKEIFIDVNNLLRYPLRDFKNINSELTTILKNFDALNHRNRKDDLHINKHEMHLIRLLIMGTELLEGKDIQTYRENEIPLFKDIIAGKYSTEEIFEIVKIYEDRFEYAKNNTSLPSKPDYHKIEDLLMTIYEECLKTGRIH